MAVTVIVKVPVGVPPLDETDNVAAVVPPDVSVMLVGAIEMAGFFFGKSG